MTNQDSLGYQTTLLRLLATCTRNGSLSWSERIGDCYTACHGSRTYKLDWLYWYDERGIAIDRLGIILAAGDVDIVLFNGTAARQEAAYLLEAIDGEWRAHHLRLSERCGNMIADTPDFSRSSSNLTNQYMALLLSLFDCTSNGTIAWQQDTDDANKFTSSLRGGIITIDFIRPADYEDRPLERLVARLTIPGATTLFVCGTDPYLLIEQMLSQCVPAFRDAIDSQRMAIQIEIDFLNRLNSAAR